MSDESKPPTQADIKAAIDDPRLVARLDQLK
jgi:hypothetical protein